MWKKRLYAIAILLAFCAGLLFYKWYCDGYGVPTQYAAASVAEARVYPEKKDLPTTRRMLGAQVLVFRSRDYEQVERVIMDLKQAGVNTVIVRAFQNRGDRVYRFARPQCKEGVYFETSHAPVVDPLLTRIVSIGHRHGLKIFAWVQTRKMPLYLPHPEASRALAYRFETGSLEPIRMWSIFDETVETRLTGLYEDVVRSGVDGILIQDDLIMYHCEDFSAKAVTLFAEETGNELDPDALYSGVFQDAKGHWCVSRYSDTFWVWAWWKNQKLLNLARKLIKAAKAVNPEIQFAMNFMYESVTDPRNALAWLSQSLTEATKLPIDYYAIMAYHRQMKKELQLTEADAYNKISAMTATLLNLMDDPYKILMKVQMTDWKTRRQIPPYEAHQVFERIGDQGRVSLAFIPYSPTVPFNVISHHFH
jgi:biofilm PGA synthesis lipoprotein PgaB